MRNNNTTSPLVYLVHHLVWPIVAMVWYRGILFMAIPKTTVAFSRNLLWAAAYVFAALGWAVTFRRRRNMLSLVVNLLIPFEVYTVVAYCTYVPGLVWGAVAFSGIAAAAFVLLAILPDRGNAQRRTPKFGRRLSHGLQGARTIAAICMLALIIPLGGKLIFGGGIVSTKVPPVASSSAEEADQWTVKNNIDTVRLLEDAEWEKLSVQEKLDVLGVVANIEVRYLGLNHELYLKSGKLDGNTTAHYNHSNHEIVIDIEHLSVSFPDDILESLCHECYHSFQYQMIELYYAAPEEYRNMLLFQYVDDYIEEFANYADGSGERDDYYYQMVEIAARRYAAEAAVEYYDLIEEYTVTDAD